MKQNKGGHCVELFYLLKFIVSIEKKIIEVFTQDLSSVVYLYFSLFIILENTKKLTVVQFWNPRIRIWILTDSNPQHWIYSRYHKKYMF
jgi:hypothetical protein